MYYLLYSLHNETENINSDILSRNLNCSIILPANFETVLCLDYRADWDPTYIKQREIFAAITQFSRDWMNDGHSSFISGRGYWRRTHAQDGASDKFRCCMWIRRTRRDPAWEKAPAGFACASQVAQTTRRVLLGTRDLCLSSNSLSPTRICIHVICPRAFRTNSDKLFEAARWFSCSRVAAREGALFTTASGRHPRAKRANYFLLSAPWLLLQSTSIVGAFASLQLCIMPTRATLRAAATARRSHARERDWWKTGLESQRDARLFAPLISVLFHYWRHKWIHHQNDLNWNFLRQLFLWEFFIY